MKDYKVEDIKAVLLINGDEIIGPVEKHGNPIEGFINIVKPAKFVPLDQGQMMVISLFMFGDFEECTIYNRHIISIVQARKEIAEAWLERVTGKKSIIKPKGGIVVP